MRSSTAENYNSYQSNYCQYFEGTTFFHVIIKLQPAEGTGSLIENFCKSIISCCLLKYRERGRSC